MPDSKTITASGLIRESLGQIVQNRRQLLPIMGLIWLLQVPSFFSEEVLLPHDAMALMGLPPGWASIIPAIIVMMAVYIGTAWSAVGWHRLRLLGEQPARVLPQWHARPVLAYFWVSIFLPLVTFGLPALLVVPVVVLLQVLDGPMVMTLLAAIPALIAALWLSLRLSPVQVGRAVQDPIGLGPAYARTAHMSRPLWIVALLGCLFLGALIGASVLLTFLLTDPEGYYISYTALFLDGTFFWAMFFLFFLVTISMFNTIYRHMAPARDVTPTD